MPRTISSKAMMKKRAIKIGAKFGSFTVLKHIIGNGRHLCRCVCGNESKVGTSNLLRGRSKRCFVCRNIKKLSISIGERFGKLTVVRHSHERHAYLCRCDCGRSTYTRTYSLKNGKSKSCGCRNRDPRPSRRLPNDIALYRAVIRNYKRSAFRRGHSWGLSEEGAIGIMKKPCHYCKTKPKRRNISLNKNYSRKLSMNGIDRVRNRIGYTKGNSVPCCEKCNMSKRAMSTSEWKKWIFSVYHGMFNDQSVGSYTQASGNGEHPTV